MASQPHAVKHPPEATRLREGSTARDLAPCEASSTGVGPRSPNDHGNRGVGQRVPKSACRTPGRCRSGRFRNARTSSIFICIIFSMNGCSQSGVDDTIETNGMQSTASGLRFKDIQIGAGIPPKPGQTCLIAYSGWLWEDGRKGKSIGGRDRGRPFRYKFGRDKMIKGSQEGIASMKPGGRRLLIVPPSLGYGEKGGGGGIIPANATLFFDVEMIEITGKPE